ncbi:thymidine phosphorylase [Kordiimonas pumila]|uniref:Thymidine phosphorylase n=1 Tax=Kordiimonas pumila TaxID=2161677 RepID=A0ABV7D8I4_9PROT|nr:thymidine phosphorylase [Kordiimonas pumila]
MANKGFLPQEVIRLKRDGAELSAVDIQNFVAGITDAAVSDAQISAFAMAVFFNGMTPAEGAALTLSMRDSGSVINWQNYGFDEGAPITDKHSTGGVGDKVSLMLAPIVAACGGFVPMISGRGLGHTGGTLDKFEAIPGYNPYPSIEDFAKTVKRVGCSIIGQTGSLAPADKRFYSVRDVTATVESIPLITASILSKKLAAGLGSLVMDVKFGSGAFMANFEKAKELAENIVRVANRAGTPTTAVMTDMNAVLGRTVGNAVEVIESAEFLINTKEADTRLVEVTLELAAHMLVVSGRAGDLDTAKSSAKAALDSGRAAEVFAKMVAAQGGPSDFMEKYTVYLPVTDTLKVIPAKRSGYVTAMDARAVGMAVVALGGGRTDPAQSINHAVGFKGFCQIGDWVESGEPLAYVYADTEMAAEQATHTIQKAVQLSDQAPQKMPVVAQIIRE